MMRAGRATYARVPCFWCSRLVGRAGAAWHSHLAGHFRERFGKDIPVPPNTGRLERILRLAKAWEPWRV